MKKLRVDVWSDIACPWCYIGKRRLEEALKSFPNANQVEVVWRAFELDPAAPRERDPGVSYAERLASKYGSSVSEAQGMIARMTAVAKKDGVNLDFGRIHPGNTFDAHRILHLARQRGLQGEVKERLFQAYFTQGEPIGDAQVVGRVAAEAGLDLNEVQAVLSGEAHADTVRADEREARELGIGGVPFYVIGNRYRISGAQPAEVLVRALTQAWDCTPNNGQN